MTINSKEIGVFALLGNIPFFESPGFREELSGHLLKCGLSALSAAADVKALGP